VDKTKRETTKEPDRVRATAPAGSGENGGKEPERQRTIPFHRKLFKRFASPQGARRSEGVVAVWKKIRILIKNSAASVAGQKKTTNEWAKMGEKKIWAIEAKGG